MPHLYLSEWVWNEQTQTAPAHWSAPGFSVGCVDFRTLAQAGQSGGRDAGYGAFVYESPQSGMALALGDDLDATLTPAQLSGLEGLLGLQSGALLSRRLRDVLRELLWSHYDATGETRWKPARGSRRRGARIALGGMGVVASERFGTSHPAYAATVAVFQADYRRNRAAGVNETLLRKWTGAEMLKLFGRMRDDYADALMPPEHRGDGWERPETDISDDFESDSSASWTADSGGLTVDAGGNGYLEASGTEMVARHNTALSSDDHYAEAAIDALGSSWQGVMTRKAGSSALTYVTALKQGTGTAIWQLYQRVSGSYTNVGNLESLDHADGDVYRLESDSSDQQHVYKNGVEMANSPITNATGTGNLSVGLVTNTTTDFEAFGASDGAGGGGGPSAANNLAILGVG